MLLRRYRTNGVGHVKPTPKPTKEDVEVVIEKTEEETPQYTKTDINRMNKETLIEKATEIGVKDAEELSGNVLKEKLIEYYEL